LRGAVYFGLFEEGEERLGFRNDYCTRPQRCSVRI
jgi:hypothetical protein